MENGHGSINRGTIAAGSGKLATIAGTIGTTTTVTTPIVLGDGNHFPVDDLTIAGFGLTNGDVLNLTSILAALH